MIRDAIKLRSSFNLIHLETMLKINVYIPKSRSFDQEELGRVQQEVLLEGTRPLNVASPEGTILNKLECTAWVAKYPIDNGTIFSVYSKFKELISIWLIFNVGQQI
jgi:hypothetical protein